jgi:hypothetical protein
VTRRFKPPVYATTRAGVRTWRLNIGSDEQAIVRRLLLELRALLASSDDDESTPTSPLLKRLFPRVYTDDEEKEAEYQRLMREELVTSRIFQIDAVIEMLDEAERDPNESLTEGRVTALMQSLNAVRVVLGTMLDVGEDDEIGSGVEGDELEPERQLYGYLSWLLDWTVRSLSP